jgi:hypothetical protein
LVKQAARSDGSVLLGNGDAIPALAVRFGGGVRVLLGNGDSTFQTTPISYLAGTILAGFADGRQLHK